MTSEAHNTPVSTPSGPSAGLEGQVATRETPDATEAAQERVERYEDLAVRLLELNDFRAHDRAVASRVGSAYRSLADQEQAEKDATIAELRAEVERWKRSHGIESARLREAKAALIELAPSDEVLVEGSFFQRADLPRILGNYMRAADEHGREAKELFRRAEAAEAEVERLRKPTVAAVMGYELGAGDLEHAEARVAELEATVAKVREFAEEVRSHPPVTPTTTGEEMLSIRLQRWFADDLEVVLDAPKDTTAP